MVWATRWVSKAESGAIRSPALHNLKSAGLGNKRQAPASREAHWIFCSVQISRGNGEGVPKWHSSTGFLSSPLWPFQPCLENSPWEG